MNETMARRDKASLHATCSSCLEGLVEPIVLATHEEGAGHWLEAAQLFARVAEESKNSYSHADFLIIGTRCLTNLSKCEESVTT